eukprot:335874_1
MWYAIALTISLHVVYVLGSRSSDILPTCNWVRDEGNGIYPGCIGMPLLLQPLQRFQRKHIGCDREWILVLCMHDNYICVTVQGWTYRNAHGRDSAPAPTIQIINVNTDPLTDPAWNLSCKYMVAPRGVHIAYDEGLLGVRTQ